MKRIFSLVLVVIMMLSVLAACQNGDNTDANDNSSEAPADPSAGASDESQVGSENKNDLLLTVDAKYVVVRPADCDDAIVDAAIELKTALATVTGGSVALKEDFLRSDEAPAQYEILIGQTNREESIKALEGLKYDDYIVTVSGDKLVINSYSTEKLVEAVAYVKDIVVKSTGSVIIKNGDLKTEKAEYKFEEIKCGDTSLGGYTIIIPADATALVKTYADRLQATILENSGELLPIKKDSSKETDKEILLGSTSRDASKKIKPAGLETNGYKIVQSGSKIVIKGKDDDYVFLKTMSDVIAKIEESGSFAAEEGKITVGKDPLFTAFCFTDVHNNFAMLEPTNSTGDYIVRKNVDGMIDHLLDTVGAVDLVMVGGDLMSDYPHWVNSGTWPYGYFVEYRQLLIDTFSRLAKDGKTVTFCGGNHDYGQGENAIGALHVAKGYEAAAPHTPTGNYNSSDFYFGDAGMRQNIGELPEEDMYWKVGENTGDKYLICYYYKMGDIHVMGLAPDPDIIFNRQGDGFSDESLEWLDKKLDEIDPYGTEIIFINCHYPLDCVYEDASDPNKLTLKRDQYNYNKLVNIYKGHPNLFHFYGHWESWYHDYSVKAVLHYTAGGEPILMQGTETSSLGVLGERKRSFNAVLMGHFRPMWGENKQLFYTDSIKGYGGYATYAVQHGSTTTPRVSQGMYVQVYDNRIVFTMKNYGTYKGLTTDDVLQPYTVWLYR